MRTINILWILSIFFFSCDQAKEGSRLNEHENLINIGERIILHSDVLNEDREILIYIPSGFYGMDETDLRYPVTYVMDGESQFLSTVATLEQMSSPFSANDLIPQMIVVGIVNTNRNRDLTPTPGIIGSDSSSIQNTGGADLMATFIEKELFPYIDENYPTTAHRTLIGHSLGGLFVLNTMTKFSHLFQNYLAIDPFLKWDKHNFANSVIETLSEEDFEGKKLYVATANTSMSWLSLEDVMKDTTDVMLPMRSNLEFKYIMDSTDLSFSYSNIYYEEENHFQIPLRATYDGYRFFFDFYTFKEMIEYYYPREKEEDLFLKLEKHYKTISKEMGYTTIPMESYINSWAFGFSQFDRNDLASRLFDLNIKNYPKSYNVYSAKANHLLAQKDTLQAIELLEKSINIKEVPRVKTLLEKLQGN